MTTALRIAGTEAPAKHREAFHGVRQILRFNWPYYAVGAVAVVVAPFAVAVLPALPAAETLVYLGSALIGLWLIGSIAASWLVYDRSELMTGSWIPAALDRLPRTWIAVHAGLDEFTPVLEGRLGTRGRAFDIFDEVEMTEPSIARARTSSSPTGSEAVDFRRLPVARESVDAAFLLLSAHELRTHDSRVGLFSEIARILVPGGQAVVAEHLRNPANFAAYGPGALHFHSRRTWMRTFTAAGLVVSSERSITPFVRVFILRRSS